MRPAVEARPAIGRSWIKAHVIGGLVYTALTFVAFLLGRLLGINAPGTDFILQAAYVMVAVAAMTFGMIVLGYLAAVVLRTRLPAFPLRPWLVLHAAFGAAIGLVSALAWLAPELPADTDPTEISDLAGIAAGAAVAGVVLGAAAGALQALVLRPAAAGLGRWIGFAALAGTLFTLIVPSAVYGPQSGFASELTIELATLVIVVLAAIVMLPAVNRLRARDQTSARR